MTLFEGHMIFFCGLPVNTRGAYYCPYCLYESYNLEEFATGMCWYCVWKCDDNDGNSVNKEEKMTEIKEEVITDVTKLKYGDKIRVTREAVVSSTDRHSKTVRTKDNRTIRLEGSYDYDGKVIPGFKIVRLTEVNPRPEHWPVQPGDVWADCAGNEYHVFHSSLYGDLIYDADVIRILPGVLVEKPGLKLVYRKGNRK
jgi:hypothetical protein